MWIWEVILQTQCWESDSKLEMKIVIKAVSFKITFRCQIWICNVLILLWSKQQTQNRLHQRWVLQESTRTQEISSILMENPSNSGSIEGLKTGWIGESKLPKTIRLWDAEFFRSCYNFINTEFFIFIVCWIESGSGNIIIIFLPRVDLIPCWESWNRREKDHRCKEDRVHSCMSFTFPTLWVSPRALFFSFLPLVWNSFSGMNC